MESDSSFQRRNYDSWFDVIVAPGPKQGQVMKYDFDELRAWLEKRYRTVNWRRQDWRISPVTGCDFEIIPDPMFRIKPDSPTEIGVFIYDSGFRQLEFEPVTPRFVVQFLRTFSRDFPENNDIYTVVHSLTYGRFNPLLSDDDAMNMMLSDDEALMRELDVI